MGRPRRSEQATRLPSTAVTRLEACAVAVVLALLVALTVLELTGHRLFVVSGASMEPGLLHGSLVIVQAAPPQALTVGDVVTFQHRGQTVTHRVAAIAELPEGRVFRTKGDANDAVDPEPVTFDREVGLVQAHVPIAGYALALVQAYGGAISLVAALAIGAWAVRRAHATPKVAVTT